MDSADGFPVKVSTTLKLNQRLKTRSGRLSSDPDLELMRVWTQSQSTSTTTTIDSEVQRQTQGINPEKDSGEEQMRANTDHHINGFDFQYGEVALES